MTRYYRYGELDSCEGRWDAIWACMDSRKRSGQGLSSKAPVIADAKEERAKPYWNLMDPKVSAVCVAPHGCLDARVSPSHQLVLKHR